MTSAVTNRCPPLSAAALAGAAAVAGLAGWLLHGLDRNVDRLSERQQAAAVEEFHQLLRMWTDEGGAGRAGKALGQLKRIHVARLTPPQQRQWQLAAARVYLGLATDEPEHAERHAAMARWYYHQVLGASPAPADQAAALQGLIDLNFQEQQWDAALRLLDEIEAVPTPDPPAREQALQRAACHFGLGETAAGLAALARVLDSAPRDELRARALVLRLQQQLKPLQEAFEAGEAVDPDALQAIRDSALEALTLTTSSNPDRGRALNGLLQTCVLSGDADGAYRYVATLQDTVLPVHERVRSYLLLSRLEEQRGRLEAAIRPLRFCLLEFPHNAKTHAAYRRLYRLLAGQGRWVDALDVFQQQAESLPQWEVARDILDHLIDPTYSPLEPLSGHPSADALGAKLETLLDTLRHPDRPGWQDVYDDVLFVAARTAFACGRYPETEDRIQTYLEHAPLQRHLADILWLDLTVAVEGGQPPIVRTVRAERFLHRFVDHPDAPGAMTHLLDAYLELGLYDALIDAGKKAFMKEIVRLDRTTPEEGDPLWLATVAKIAQAYARQGDTERANQLFRACMHRYHRYDCPLSVYLDWADAATQMGQRREALRRLRIAAETRRSPEEEARLRLEQDLLRLQSGDPQAFHALDPHSAPAPLGAAAVEAQSDIARRLWESWLDRAVAASSPWVPTVLDAVVEAHPAAAWPEYWRMRMMNRHLETGRPAAAHALAAPSDQTSTAGPDLAQSVVIARAAGRLNALEQRIQALSARGLKNETAP